MALKDWGINKQADKITFSWHNKKIGEFVWVYLQDYDKECWGYNKKSEWFFEVHKHNVTTIEKVAKSQKQAMDYAKDYMEKN